MRRKPRCDEGGVENVGRLLRPYHDLLAVMHLLRRILDHRARILAEQVRRAEYLQPPLFQWIGRGPSAGGLNPPSPPSSKGGGGAEGACDLLPGFPPADTTRPSGSSSATE